MGREFHSIDRLRLDKYMFLVRCYVGVAFEVFMKGKQQPKQDDNDGSGKKRKREEEAAAAAAEAATTTKGGKKQSKRSKGKKHAGEDEEQATTTNGSQTNITTTNEANEENDTTGNKTKWSDLNAYLTILEEGPLNPLNFDPDQPSAIDEKTDYVPMPHGPDGLRYHIMDLWLDELEKVLDFEESHEDDKNAEEGGEDDDGAPKFASRKIKSDAPMDILLRPIETLRVKGLHRPVRVRAAETLEDDRLVEWGVKERKVDDKKEDEDESEEEWGGFGDE